MLCCVCGFVDADWAVVMMFLDAGLSAHDAFAGQESCGLGRDWMRVT